MPAFGPAFLFAGRLRSSRSTSWRAPRQAHGLHREWRRRPEEQLVEAERTLDAVSEEATKGRRKMCLSPLVTPVDGVVMDVAKRSVGSVLQAAEPPATIVPADAPLEADVEVKAADRGTVRASDSARLKLDPLPFQRYGTIDGR